MGFKPWPTSVTIQTRIGRKSYKNINGPVCAMGWAFKEFKVSRLIRKEQDERVRRFREAYLEIAQAYSPPPPPSHKFWRDQLSDATKWLLPEQFNDQEKNPQIRALVYNATWAYLGYTVNQSPETIELAMRAKDNERRAIHTKTSRKIRHRKNKRRLAATI